MAPVPPQTTVRIRVRQIGPRGTHRMLFHGTTGADPGQLAVAVRAVLTQMADCCYSGTIFQDAEIGLAGQTFFNPFPSFAPIQAPNTFVPTATDPTGVYGNFVGRSANTGVRVRLFLYNFAFKLRDDMRYELGEQTAIDQVIAQLKLEDASIGAIDGSEVIWKDYCNVGVNDYWTRRDRLNG